MNGQRRRLLVPQNASPTASPGLSAQRAAIEAVVAPPAAIETGLALHQAGQIEQAAAIYQAILAADPRHPQALHLLGVVAHQTGQDGVARQLMEAAIASDPAVPGFHANLGNVLLALGNAGAAIASYRAALLLDPTAADTQANLGNVLLATGDRAGAIASYRAALQTNPGLADAHENLGTALQQDGDLVGACESYRRAGALRPTATTHGKLGRALLSLGRSDEAAEAFRQQLALAPNSPEAHNDLGAALHAAGAADAALASFEAALACSPDFVDAHRNLGWVALRRGQPARAAHHLQRAAALAPDDANAHEWLGTALRDGGQMAEAVQSLRRAVALAPAQPALASSLLFALHMDSACSRDALFAEAVAWGRRHAAPLSSQIRPHANRPEPDRRLRIGYIGTGFGHHPVGTFLAPILAAHDLAQVEVFAYVNDEGPDAMTPQLRATTHHWREIAGQDDAATAELVRSDRIDVLVDLMGHTLGNRLLVLARKPAPVQASWLGYFDTTGIEAIDYVIADASVCPTEDDERYVERVVRLPDSYLCYPGLNGAPTPGELPALRRGAPTFGCFNHLSKVSPEVIRLWATLLKRVPDARLLLKAPSLGDPQVQARVRDQFAAHGIGPDRLTFLGSSSQAVQLAAYGEVDVALDPFPYNGGTTTAEALWMGVPVVTLPGDRWVSRVGSSMLHAAGLPELVAATPAEYVDLAASLVADVPRLAALRAELRARVTRSALCDATRVTRALERAYREMWRGWCRRAGAEAVA